jgi:hypothetical protein
LPPLSAICLRTCKHATAGFATREYTVIIMPQAWHTGGVSQRHGTHQGQIERLN